MGPSLQTSHSPPLFVFPACQSDEKPSQALQKKATQSIPLTVIDARACDATQLENGCTDSLCLRHPLTLGYPGAPEEMQTLSLRAGQIWAHMTELSHESLAVLQRPD